MFKKVTLDNFKSFGHIEFDLSGKGKRPKNCALVYGENGSGKSNLISSFVFLKETLDTLENDRSPTEAFGIDIKESSKFHMYLMDTISRKANLQKITGKYRMKSSKDGVKVNFSFQINGHEGYYEIGFDDQDRLVSEKLFHLLDERAGPIFEINKRASKYDSMDDEIVSVISPSMFKNQFYKKETSELINQYWGKHTLFSILNAQMAKSNEKFMTASIGSGALEALDFFNDYVVFCEEDNTSKIYGPFSERILTKLSHGIIPSDGEKQLLVFEEALNDFFTRTYPDIKKVFYKKERAGENTKYELFFRKLIYGELRDISINSESTGTKRLLGDFPAFYDCALGKTTILDEMDTGIHDLLMNDVFNDIVPSFKGQFIATTHNTLLLERAPPEQVYIIRTDASGYKVIECIKSIDRTQKNHNNRNRYLSGMFDGVPIIGAIGFSEIVSRAHSLLEVKK